MSRLIDEIAALLLSVPVRVSLPPCEGDNEEVPGGSSATAASRRSGKTATAPRWRAKRPRSSDGAARKAAAGKARRAAKAAERARRPEVRAEVLERVSVLTDQWERLPVAARREVLTRLAERVEVVPAARARTHEVVAPRIAWRSAADLTAET